MPNRARHLVPCVLLAVLAGPVSAQAPVAYHLSYPRPGAPTVTVRIEWPEPLVAPATFVMPRAIPMGYGNVLYDRNVEELRAFSPEGGALAVRRQEGPRWQLGDAGERVHRVEYRVNLARLEREVFSAADASKIRPGYVGILGYSVFGYAAGRRQRPIRLRVRAPADWPVFSTLAPRAPPSAGTLEAGAQNFYELADAQLLLGPDVQVQRLDTQPPLFLAAYAETEIDLQVIGALARDALERTVAYFGGAPFPHYTVYLEFLRPVSPQHAYGFSMEHLNSGTFFLGVDRALTQQTSAKARRRTFANFVHHIAHSWIPKRAYGEGYFPFNWELAPLLDTIWLSEGFVRYATLEIVGAGRPDSAAYLASTLQQYRQYVDDSPDFIRRMSLVELSRVGSTAYSTDFRIGRNLYMRGALLAADLDIHLRQQTHGRARLRDVLRYLLTWCARHQRGFRVDELPAIFHEATGVEVRAILERGLQPDLK